MARERTGFIVSQVCALIEYVDASGQHHKISKAARAADSKNKLSDAQKQAAKVKAAGGIIRDTIADLKKQRATKVQRLDRDADLCASWLHRRTGQTA